MTKKIFENLKSQVAMEYLTTYAWGLLVILAIIGIIYYFGVWDFASPRHCILIQGLSCYDFKVQSDEVRISLLNNFGLPIKINTIEMKNCSIISPDQVLEEDINEIFIIPCSITEKKYTSELKITYTARSGLQHIIKGKIRDKVGT